MKITYVAMERFRSFHSQTGVGLDTSPGLYFMTGENRVEPELEANGTGKSSFWEAICWALYGKTSRNLRASDIGTWEIGKGTVVELGGVFDAEPEVLRRGWSPNFLQLGGKDITQEELEAKVGLTFNAFLHSIFISQFGATFLDLGASDKANLLSEVLDLDRWLEYAEKASAEAKKLQSEVFLNSSAIDHAEGQRVEIYRQLEEAEGHLQSWEAERQAALETLLKSFEAFDVHIASIQQSVDQRRSDEKEAVAALDLHTQTIKELDKDLAKNASYMSEVRVKLSVETEQLRAAKEKKQKLLEGTCSVCGQDIAHEYASKHIRQLGLVRLTDSVDLLAEEVEKLDKERSTLEAARRGRAEKLRDASVVRERARELVDTKVQQLTAARNEKAVRESEFSRLRGASNPHAKVMSEGEERLVEVCATILQKQDVLEQLTAKHRAIAFWSKGFRDLRLFLISNALMQLELEVNNALMQLGLIDWSMEFAIDAETKSGTTRRGFSVLVKAPHSRGPVPWEAWSGGESQRLRLAAQLGLSSLILNHTGVECNLEIWDEPSTWMSSKGIEDLLDSLASRSSTLGKSIWVVDHRALEYGGFARVMRVVKDSDGSHVEGRLFGTQEDAPSSKSSRRRIG